MPQTVTSRARTPHFKPNRDITWSNDWKFSIVNQRHINNFGFVDDQDYDPNGEDWLLAVIGDSYVQSMMVPYEASIQGRLAACTAVRARVYSFGVSGAQLSTYLVFAEYARELFRPNGMVIVIIGNDFDESWLKFKRAPMLTYFTENSNGNVMLETVPYHTSRVKRLLRKSALARYLALNLGLKARLELGLDLLKGNKSTFYVANTLGYASPERLQASRRGVDTFLARLPEAAGLTSDHILFVVDGIRRQIYDEINTETAETSFVHNMRSYFISAARARSYEVIDMHQVFGEHFRQHGQRFEFPTDAHWNALGHDIAAAEVCSSRVSTANSICQESCSRYTSGHWE